jgi:LPXTG-motif cell wall-anchored protein
MKPNDIGNRRYSLRKLSVGLASVMLGISFVASANTAQADETNSSDKTPAVVETNEKPAATDQTVEDENEQSPLVPIETSRGQTPDPKAAIPNWENYANAYSSQDASKFKVDWETAPDTLKTGNTTGKIKITGENYDESTNTAKETTKTVAVPVTVYNSDQDYLIDEGNISDPSTKNSDQLVKNILKIYDIVNKKIVRTDSFTGYANSSADSEYGYDLKNILEQLGYQEVTETPYQNGSELGAFQEFTDHDQYFTVFVQPKFVAEGDQDYQTVPKLKDNLDAYTYLDWKHEVDPAEFIGNIAFLPAGTKVEWNVKPQFDLSKADEGNYNNVCPINHPSIKVTVPGQDQPYVLGGTEDSILNSLSLPMDAEDATVKGNLETVAGQDIAAKDALGQLGTNITPDQVDQIQWTIKPNFAQPGYTYGQVKLPDGTFQYVLIHVLPQQSQTDDPIVEPVLPPYVPTTPPDDHPVTPVSPNEKPKPIDPEKPEVVVPKNKKHKRTGQITKTQKLTKAAGVQTASTTKTTAAVAAQSENELPQTGNKAAAAALAGLAAIAGALALGMFDLLKKRN